MNTACDCTRIFNDMYTTFNKKHWIVNLDNMRQFQEIRRAYIRTKLFLPNQVGWKPFPSSGCYADDTLTFFSHDILVCRFRRITGWMKRSTVLPSLFLKCSVEKKSRKVDNKVESLWPSPDSVKQIEYRTWKNREPDTKADR